MANNRNAMRKSDDVAAGRASGLRLMELSTALTLIKSACTDTTEQVAAKLHVLPDDVLERVTFDKLPTDAQELARLASVVVRGMLAASDEDWSRELAAVRDCYPMLHFIGSCRRLETFVTRERNGQLLANGRAVRETDHALLVAARLAAAEKVTRKAK